MFAYVALTALLATRAYASVAMCGGLTYFGEDKNEDADMNDALPLDSFPNALLAETLFLGALVDPVTEDFEDIGGGIGEPILDFGDVSATLSGGVTRTDPPLNGQYAISPVTYYSAGEDFTLVFSEPVSAFGFYGVDVGDVEGVLTVTFIQEDMSDCTLTVPHEVDGPSGGVLYFGYIDIAMPFISVKFSNSESLRDRFGFDNFTIAKRDDLGLCLFGITNSDETVCCDAGCGACGGCDCEMNPGGPSLCCPGTIAASGIECVISEDVGCLLGAYVPSPGDLCL